MSDIISKYFSEATDEQKMVLRTLLAEVERLDAENERLSGELQYRRAAVRNLHRDGAAAVPPTLPVPAPTSIPQPQMSVTVGLPGGGFGWGEDADPMMGFTGGGGK